jgi:mono/diheme cytochrome c family protein
VALLCGALVAVVGAGCGRTGDPDLANGKELFIGKGTCGSCHTLERAGTQGTQGPNLDDAFAQARRDGLGQKTIEGVVKRQIAHTRRSSIMPSNLVKGQDARDVAAYVALVAGKRGKDQGFLATAGAPKVSNKPIPAKGGKLEIDADPTGALAFASKKALAPGGALEVLSVNKATIKHNIALKDGSGKLLGSGAEVSNGGTSKLSAKVKPGTYEFLCTVPGHADGGMRGTLTVK